MFLKKWLWLISRAKKKHKGFKMSIRKSGTCESSTIVSSSIYTCPNCGHTEIVKDKEEVGKNCPKCDTSMRLISSQTELA